MGSSPESVAVVAVPFPAQGHLNQLLHLSLQLAASRGLEVHYAAPAPHVRQARARVHGWDDEALLSIRFHHLGISTYASPPPDPAAELSFPSHFMPLWETYSADARAPLSALLGGLSASRRRVVVLYDLLCSFAAEEAARLPNGESFGFHCTSVSYMLGKLDAEHRLLRENGLHYLPVHSCVTKEFLDYVYNRAAVEQASASAAGILANTCRALEGDFIDAAAEALAAGGKKLFAVGPFNPVLLDAGASGQSQRRHECLDWLDRQPPASVLYISFGSMSSMREGQITELAAALRGSKQRFIWVSRDADRGNIFTGSGESESRHAKLLAEFSRESEGTGLVITGWAPQLEILAHASTAAFMSHCGWNSTMESMSHGKPVLSWPMNCDQPWDAELICKHFKAGILVRPWEKHGEVVPATAIQEVIEKMMVSEEGMAVRQRAKAVGDAVRSAVAVGGSSREDLERFVAHITR
ncbi:cis-zeatin O-glucosyltransferase 1-like [Oryza brachyantha]|uniref:cis-zeatin O-glucosyltransferase 1-like n=1 Tax=Oryza brachyantha TaxID=4533 RepID=UPI001ADC4587|nr:cis-zeatin O-glucosyltransferase 1-like [Oryza brachyantha]